MTQRGLRQAAFGLFVACASISAAQEASEPSNNAAEPKKPPTLAAARDLFMTGHYDDAIAAYEALADDAAKAVSAGVGLAECRIQIGRYDEAQQALEAVDGSADAHWHFALARLMAIRGRYDAVLDHARTALERDPRHAGARFLLAETLEQLGRRDEAIQTYRWFEEQLVNQTELPRDAAWVTSTALGFLRYSVLTQTNVTSRTQHVLNELLQSAYERIDRTWWPARIAAADLLREKFNNDEEDGSVSDYMAALRINAKLPQAQVGLGEALLEGWQFEEVERHVDAALAVNPNFAPAIHLQAKKLLRERRYEEAAETCDRALIINPNDLIALSLRAAASACQYQTVGVEEMRSRVAKVNPRCALLHRVLGDALGGIRQYAAAEREYLEAIELDPTDANARTELGMMYMQWGPEDKARLALEGAWALDPFNQRTKFTLELLESLEKFDRRESDHFVVKFDADRDPILGEVLGEYLERIHGAVLGDYDATLDAKTVIEVFPTQRAFGVRITGKPWIHTVGACTGSVIALAAPRDGAGLLGSYDVARVLKHEFTHTVTLAATHNRIPHWFTEGLAVAQEDAPRSFEWRKLLADAVRREQLFTLESIDWGFIRPRRPNERQMAYAQSEWMCEYIVERFGYDSIDAMIRLFRDGRTQAEVFSEQFGLDAPEFDRAFAAWAAEQAGNWGFDLSPLEDIGELRAASAEEDVSADVLGRLAKAEFDEGQLDRALAASRRALAGDENDANALTVFAEVLLHFAREEGSTTGKRAYEDEALPVLERLATVDPEGCTAPRGLAEIALRREQWDRAIEPLRRLQRLCPLDPLSWRGLGGIYLTRGDDDRALPQLLEVARWEERDSEVPAGIAGIYRRRGKLQDARYWYERAIYMAPADAEIHRLLGDTQMQGGDTAAALRSYVRTTRLAPDDVRGFAAAAKAAHKMGDKEVAHTMARRAVELDPSSDVQSLLP